MNYRHTGLTLLELLIALGIITTLLGLSLPSMQTAFKQYHGEHVLHSISSAINAGRTAAVARNIPVSVCPSNDGWRCSGTWNDGLIVFTDPDGQRDPTDSGEILQQIRWPELSGHIRWRAFGNRQYLEINTLGNILHQNGNFTWCPHDGDRRQAHQLVVNITGRMRLARDSNGDGIREDSQDRPLECS